MKISIYVRIENLEELNNILQSINSINSIGKELYTTSNAQRTHFHGWVEVHIDYEDFVILEKNKEK